MRLRRDQHRQNRAPAGLNEISDVEISANEGALGSSGLVPVHPNLRAVVNAAKVQPYAPAFEFAWHNESRAIPPAGFVQVLGNAPHVFAVQRLGIDLVVYQCGQHRSRYSRRIPSIWLV